MKRLILVRHAKSSWSNPNLRDHERPLAERGIRDAPKMFARLSEHLEAPDLILSSDAERAATTATYLARALSYPSSQIVLDSRLYAASPNQILEIVRQQDDEAEAIALVGHNPVFTDLANRLIRSFSLDNLPTCGVVAMAFSSDSWEDVAPGGAELLYLDYPKNTGAPIIPV